MKSLTQVGTFLSRTLHEGSTRVEYYLTVSTDKHPTATPTGASL